MKKFLTSLLCVMMVVCFMPGLAWADGDAADPNNTVVAKIGNAEYSTLADAVAATQGGEEIILQADVTCQPIAFNAGVTLNLNGKTLTIENDDSNVASGLKFSAGEVVIKNGTIIDNRGNKENSSGYRTIHLDSVTASMENVTIKAYKPTNT